MGAIALDWTAMVAVSAKKPKAYVDFASVPPSQWKMHDRLTNWARWSRGASGERARITLSPMFGLYRSSEARTVREYGSETSVPIDHADATRIHVGVTALPDKHRRAIQWSYLDGRHPGGAARELAVTLERLCELVQHGRLMLINRGV
jgi:DNA-directed RNA polymerase specialized sigma24 family protein